ncbi:MAG: MFS transporter [Aquabacterium sp.]
MSRPAWLMPLLAMLAFQAALTLLGRVAPILAPAFITRNGWTPGEVGALSSWVSVGSTGFLLLGIPVLRRLGAVRCLQAGIVIGVTGLAALLGPLPLAMAGALMIGLSYGPSNSAGSEVLQRLAPPRHLNLIFSIKQAGVPLGGIVAGLLLPGLAQQLGLPATLALVGLVCLATMWCLEPLRTGSGDAASRDAPQGGWAALLGQVLSAANLMRPWRALAQSPRLLRMGLSGAAVAFGQGTWFTFLVVYLNLQLGWSPVAAGAGFALMQAVSVLARPVLGWLSDRMGSGVPILRWCAGGSALTTVGLALTTPATPALAVWALCALAGLTVSAWNGVQLAEVARCAQGGRVADVAGGATLVTFCAFVLSPLTVSAVLALGGTFGHAFALVGLLTLGTLPALWRIERWPVG